jgi:hypothetical protein
MDGSNLRSEQRYVAQLKGEALGSILPEDLAVVQTYSATSGSSSKAA